ncbi:MAG: hypothetical protein CL725_09805 [Chloroflexi bacterium]|nr:hypothetical protein [Chloroflexota bacterium]|tara:strand:- start:2575 stop:4239 length:1665 start_codon:yes stop_codon:yes gene_type:complete
MKDALLVAIGAALDGVDIGFCAFDSQDRTIGWNATFLSIFPEHDGHVYVGEPYAENLRRFYSLRLHADQINEIDRYIAEGIQRHQTQRRPYEFDYRNSRLRVSSVEIGKFGRLRVWRKVAMLLTHVERPASSTLTLAGLDARAALERLADGVLVVNLANNVLWANPAFLVLYGLSSLEKAVGKDFESLYRGAWRGKEDASFAQSLHRLTESQLYPGAPFELMLPGERCIRVVEQRGNVDGRGYFVHVDITHIKRQQQALAEAEERYRLLAHYSSDIIFLVESGTITYASPALTELLGWRADEVCGQAIVKFCHPGDLAQANAALRSLEGQSEAGYRARALCRNGGYLWVEARARVLPEKLHANAGRLVINVRNISARKAVEDELENARLRLQKLASTDGLTGLANRRKLDETLTAEFRRHQRESTSFSLIIIDVDHFKKLNDNHGHQVGDIVLRQLGLILLQSAQRAGDLAARLGGEEFVLVLTGVGAERALIVAENLRMLVSASKFDSRLDVPVTISIGVATNEGCATVEDMLGRADAALYEAKRSGRNRVCN